MRKMGSGLDISEKMVLSVWISRVDHGKVMDANRVLTFILYGMACQGPMDTLCEIMWSMIHTWHVVFWKYFWYFSGCFHVPRYLMMCEQMLKELLDKKNWQYLNLLYQINRYCITCICHSIHHDVIHTVYKIITISGWNPIVFMASLAKSVKNDGKSRKMFKMMASLEKYVKNEFRKN